MTEDDVVEDMKNVGALSANTTTVFDLTDGAAFPRAKYADVRELQFVNDSQATPEVRFNGQRFHLRRGRSGILTAGGRIREFTILLGGVAIADKELQVIAAGRLLPAHRGT